MLPVEKVFPFHSQVTFPVTYLFHVLSLIEVPNLFEPEEYEQVLNGTRPYAKEAGIPEGDR